MRFGLDNAVHTRTIRMKIKIIAVGKLKDDFNTLGVKEYSKRLTRFAEVEIKEVAEENFVRTPNPKEIEIIKEKEGERIEKELVGKVVALDIEGKQLSSEELSAKIEAFYLENSAISFVIGGSYGLSDKIKKRADLRLSFSRMTFPHGLFRTMLVEQIYRAFTIKEKMPYHK